MVFFFCFFFKCIFFSNLCVLQSICCRFGADVSVEPEEEEEVEEPTEICSLPDEDHVIFSLKLPKYRQSPFYADFSAAVNSVSIDKEAKGTANPFQLTKLLNHLLTCFHICRSGRGICRLYCSLNVKTL